jgi:hypothetical protein
MQMLPQGPPRVCELWNVAVLGVCVDDLEVKAVGRTEA